MASLLPQQQEPIPSLSELSINCLLDNGGSKGIEQLLQLHNLLESFCVLPSDEGLASSSTTTTTATTNTASSATLKVSASKIQKRIYILFPILLHQYEETSLKEILGSSFYEKCFNFHEGIKKETERFRSNTSSGTIIKENVTNYTGDTAIKDVTFFPLEALVKGVVYPCGLDVKSREEYLSDAEFLSVFGIDKMAFKKLDRHQRKERKEKVGLF